MIVWNKNQTLSFFFSFFHGKSIFFLYFFHGISTCIGIDMPLEPRNKTRSNLQSYYLSKFHRWSLMIIITWNIRTIDLIFIVIMTSFRLICPSAFFRCFMLNLGVQGSVQDSVWTLEFNMKHLKKADAHISWNVVIITIKVRSIVRLFYAIITPKRCQSIT